MTATIRAVTDPEDPVLAGIEPHFQAMHDEMASQGMLLRLADDGARTWLNGVRGGLERFGRLAVAGSDGIITGFAHASVKLAPEHLGGARMGHITHVYVAPEYRRTGIARSLVVSLHEWLHAREVTSIELQVVKDNRAGLAFWSALGYTTELLQLRKV